MQEVVDEAWDDPDNQEVLTSLEAQTGARHRPRAPVEPVPPDLRRRRRRQGEAVDPPARRRDGRDPRRRQAPPPALVHGRSAGQAQVRLQARPVADGAGPGRRQAALLRALAERRARPRGEGPRDPARAAGEGAARRGQGLPRPHQPLHRAEVRDAPLPADAPLVHGLQRLREGPHRRGAGEGGLRDEAPGEGDAAGAGPRRGEADLALVRARRRRPERAPGAAEAGPRSSSRTSPSSTRP